MKSLLNNEKRVTFILAALLIASILLPLYNIFYIYPSFESLLLKNIEDDAVHISAYLSSMFFPHIIKLQKDGLSHEIIQLIELIKKDFNLSKLKIFSSSGEVVYSTKPDEIGQRHENPDFYDLIAKGKIYSKIIKKGMASLEGQNVALDVAEIYVPIMKNGQFFGAFEIYYDITTKKQRIDHLVELYSAILYFIAIISIVVIIFLYKANKQIIIEKEKWDTTFNSITTPIAIIDKEYKIIQINKAMATRLHISKDDAVGIKCYELMHGKHEPILECPHSKLLVDHQPHTLEIYEERLGGWFIMNASPIYNAKRQLIATVIIAYDISDLKKTEEELKKAYEDLFAKSSELERFYKLTVDRELRMIEMKKEINNILESLGQPKRYETDELV